MPDEGLPVSCAPERVSLRPGGSASLQPPEDLVCPVCRDVFSDPVVLSCSHSFCGACLQTWWGGRTSRECPLCNRRSSRGDPPSNLALKNLCRAFVLREAAAAADGELLCDLHSEKLKLFCLEHQQPVCLVCRDSKTHGGHRFRPSDEAARELREELRRCLRPLRDKLLLLQHARRNCDLMSEHVKLQARDTESRIREQFRALQRFLREEEEARVAALRDEGEQKGQEMRKRADALSAEIKDLSDAVRAAEEELRSDDVRFLRRCGAAVRRVQQRPPVEDPQTPPAALLDVARHLGNLGFHVWSRMRAAVSYAPVILDPNTANPEFSLSHDLTAVRRGRRRRGVPDNPERISHYRSVRGREGVGAGRHSWEVEVGDNGAWFVGVTEAANQDKGARFWHFEFYNNRYSVRTPEAPPTVLRVKRKLLRVRVLLDWSRGKLTWSDPDNNAHIHTVTHTFDAQLFPCMGTLHDLPLKVLEGKISVTKDCS